MDGGGEPRERGERERREEGNERLKRRWKCDDEIWESASKWREKKEQKEKTYRKLWNPSQTTLSVILCWTAARRDERVVGMRREGRRAGRDGRLRQARNNFPLPFFFLQRFFLTLTTRGRSDPHTHTKIQNKIPQKLYSNLYNKRRERVRALHTLPSLSYPFRLLRAFAVHTDFPTVFNLKPYVDKSELPPSGTTGPELEKKVPSISRYATIYLNLRSRVICNQGPIKCFLESRWRGTFWPIAEWRGGTVQLSADLYQM